MECNDLIKRIVDISYKAKEGHIPSSLSILNILYVLYDKILKENENHFILSKGHASIGLYVILEHFGLLEDKLDDFCKFKSNLGGHPTNKINNVKASTGSLGHGLPIGVGIALSEKITTNKNVFVIIGDGESNEGTIWESALLASNHKLNNLYCIMDYNRSNDRALKLDSVINKFKAFNWHTIEINGHNNDEILNALKTQSDKPVFILANTIKGKGIPLMENNQEWHHKTPSQDEYNLIINTINEKTIC